MNDVIVKDNLRIIDMIFEIRGKQVMLASDVAVLYNSETRIINQIIRRNIIRFPEEFCFQLTQDEIKTLKVPVNNLNYKGGNRYLPYVLTEQGIMMLSGLLKNDIAAKINVQIINAFVEMRKYISNDLMEQKFINNLVFQHDNDIKLLKESFEKIEEKTVKNHIFFEGQIYDAYSLLLDILKSAKKQIIIIDNYAGKELLDIIKKIDVNIKLYSKNVDDVLKNKYEKQYQNVEFIFNNGFHDRFIIIDDIILYHCGSSFKDLGKKCFAINRIEDDEILLSILNEIQA